MNQKITLGLPFFATFLQTDVTKLNYVVVKRKYDDGHFLLSPALKVDGINKYVFDIEAAQFFPLGRRSDSVLTVEKTFLVKTEEGIILRTNMGDSVPYTNRMFIYNYGYRVVNSMLY